jgi:argininosuccinate lyase
LTIEQWLVQLAEQHVQQATASIAHLQKADPEEWARRFHAWAESHDRTTPLLSDEAISRETIYPDRI